MVETVIWTLIYIALLVGLGYLVLWVLGQLEIQVPPMVVKVVWVIVVLLVILLLWHMLGPALSGAHMPGLR